ncbi:MAG: hypothetical protein JNL08_07485 [Planctomycetes bacterium]|nr:hypothetical protein [Planctomycetota bacterium]
MKSCLAALLCVLPWTTPTPAQSESPPAVDAPAKLAEWPTLDAPTKDRVLALFGQFKKPAEELRTAAAKDLLGIGAGAAPLLFQQVSDREPNQNDQLFAVFDAMLDRTHAALMAREVQKPRAELRRYLIRRLCTFADPDVLAVLQATTKDKDALTAFYAWLGMLALKQKEAVAPVLAYTRTNWREVGEFAAVVLPAARSPEAGQWLWDAIATASPADQMTGLRLLRYLAPKEQASNLRTYLQSKDNVVLKEAINTARVLHGERPVENLPVFQVVEMSKQWLQKL